MNADHELALEGKLPSSLCFLSALCVARMTWALDLQGQFPSLACKSYFTPHQDL